MSPRDQNEVINFDKDTKMHTFLVYHMKKFTLSVWNGQYEVVIWLDWSSTVELQSHPYSKCLVEDLANTGSPQTLAR